MAQALGLRRVTSEANPSAQGPSGPFTGAGRWGKLASEVSREPGVRLLCFVFWRCNRDLAFPPGAAAPAAPNDAGAPPVAKRFGAWGKGSQPEPETWGQPGAPGRKGVQVSSGRPLGPKAGEFSECSLHRGHEAAREGPRTG